MQPGTLRPLTFLFGVGCLLVSIQLMADTRTDPDIPNQPSQNAPQNVGKWSSVVDGLRGRIIIESAHDSEAMEEIRIYIEIQNVSSSKGWINVLFSPESCFDWQLTDRAGQPAERIGVTLLAPFQLPAWITLPANSTMRFLVSGGYSIAGGGLAFGLEEGWLWRISPVISTHYYLKMSFVNATPLRDSGAPPNRNMWKGELVLPEVVVPRNGE